MNSLVFLRDAVGKNINLGVSELFIEHLSDRRNFAQVILDQINEGMYDDYKDLLTSDSIILDLGGNIGLFSIFFAPFVKKIISVEPTPSHLEVFKDLIRKLNIDNIELIEAAISVSDEKVKFMVDTNNTTTNSLVDHGCFYSPKSIEVQGKTLLTILSEVESVAFCKMDIEGFENFLIWDKSFVEGSQKIKNIFIEFHPNNNKRILKKGAEALKKCGFETEIINFETVKGIRN
jgi:FkbM family methyltransferase